MWLKHLCDMNNKTVLKKDICCSDYVCSGSGYKRSCKRHDSKTSDNARVFSYMCTISNLMYFTHKISGGPGFPWGAPTSWVGDANSRGGYFSKKNCISKRKNLDPWGAPAAPPASANECKQSLMATIVGIYT